MCSRVGAEQTDPGSLELISLEGHFVPSRRIQNTPGTQYTNESAAVSEVIGTLILVGVVIVGIALVGVLLLSEPMPTEIPVFRTIISNQSEDIYIKHKGGDPLFAGQYQIFVDGVDQTGNFAIMSPGSDPWSVGETLAATMPAMPRRVVLILNQSGGGGGGGGTVMMESDLNPILNLPPHPPDPPRVDWSPLIPALGNLTISFQFTDSSTGENITSYFWDFGDGNTSITQSLSHAFPCNTGDSCPYSISHSATDSGGTNWEATTWLNRSAWVTVYKNLTPTITFTQDRTSGPAGSLSVTFDATQYGAIKVDSWSWSFGDTGSSSSEDPSHTYTTEGIYTVTLTATNFTLGQTTVTKNNLIQVTTPWYNPCSWHYRKKITIDHTKVSGPLSNFPVLVSLASDSDLSSKAQTDGDDLVFTSSDGTTKLSHEIESYTSGTGKLVAWVKVPSLPSGSDTDLYLYYGNSGASSQQSPTNVWSNNYGAVWHHHNNNFLDSTANSNDGTNSGSTNVAAAKIAGARDYDGSNDYVQMGSGSTIDQIWASGGTFSAWIYPTGLGGNSEGRIADKTNQASLTYGWNLYTYTGNVLRFRRAYSTTAGLWTTPAITMSAWNYVVVTYTDGTSNDPDIYINGNLVSETEGATPSGTARSDASYNLRTGNRAGGTNRAFDGIIDEIRASTTTRSAEWIQTEYTNQNNPSTFSSLGSEEEWMC